MKDPAEKKERAQGVWPRLRYSLVFVGSFFVTLAILPLYYIFGWVLFPRFIYRYAQCWTIALTQLTGARVYVKGLSRPPWDEPFVMVGNHLSYLDFAMAMQISPVPIHFIATKGLRYIPAIGGGMRLMRMIFIDRSSPEKAYRSLQEAADKIAQGRHVLSYPEGGISRDGAMGPFKKGLFRLAVTAKVPVVPMVVRGTHEVLDCIGKRSRPGRVEMEYLDPVSTEGYSEENIEELVRKVRERMLEAYGDGSLSGTGQEIFKSPWGRGEDARFS